MHSSAQPPALTPHATLVQMASELELALRGLADLGAPLGEYDADSPSLHFATLAAILAEKAGTLLCELHEWEASERDHGDEPAPPTAPPAPATRPPLPPATRAELLALAQELPEEMVTSTAALLRHVLTTAGIPQPARSTDPLTDITSQLDAVHAAPPVARAVVAEELRTGAALFANDVTLDLDDEVVDEMARLQGEPTPEEDAL